MAGSNPLHPVEISGGLSLSPRIKLLITVFRADATVSPLDEWKLKRSLVEFLKNSPSLPRSVTVPEEDMLIRRFKDLKKRKREDPVAEGAVVIRDLGFVVASAKAVKSVGDDAEQGDGDIRVLEEKLSEWRNLLVEKMDGMEVSLEGVRFRLSASSSISDDIERIRKEWEEHFAFANRRGSSRGEKHEPDTIILRGVPSRWFSEPRVSSKPSMLVTHTIFSTLGKIKNLNVTEDDDPSKDIDEDGLNVPGLYCKIVVQFDKYIDFYNAIKTLCGRSLQKEGSRLKADYELSWDKDGFFRSGRSYTQRISSHELLARHAHNSNEGPRRQSYASRYSPERIRSKRFKE